MGAFQGGRSHDATDRECPVKIGGKTTSNTDPTAVAGGDRTDAWFDVQGALVTDHRPTTWVESASAISSAAASVSHAAESGKTHFLTGALVSYIGSIYAIVDVYDGTSKKFSFHSGAVPNLLLFPRPIKFTQGNKIVIEAAAASAASGACYVGLFGYTKDD
ncbi:MAG: hypothetical protein NUW01_16195 [Gemmatimonadaceae bacterium]|nr:hypothetical protein [Gemmatimonadaceae bacterium]